MYKEGWEGEVMHPHKKRVYPLFRKTLIAFISIYSFLAGINFL